MSQPEKMESRWVPLTNAGAETISPQTLAQTIGEPEDSNFFGNQALYMGDRDGYRYVHVRDIHAYWGFLGECNYKIAAADWPIDHPMRLTQNARKWQNVEWMSSDAPPGVDQDAFLTLTPSYPLGASATQPTTMPSTSPGAHP